MNAMSLSAQTPQPVAPPCQWPSSPPGPDEPAALRRFEIDCSLSYEVDSPVDFLFLIHAMRGRGQHVLQETLTLSPQLPHHPFTEPYSGNRFMRLQAEAGPLTLRYQATVERELAQIDPRAREHRIHELPDAVLQHLVPTRYCESDLLGNAAFKLFGNLPLGHARVQAISEWIRQNIEYRIGTTDARTTARDVFVQRVGVCRDFAHLGVTFCRALNIPARLACGYACFDEPPPDFHAVFEAYLGGRWVTYDPTGMAPLDQMVLIATGQDAKDTAFATLFGCARMTAMSPEIAPVTPANRGHGPTGGHTKGPVGEVPHAEQRRTDDAACASEAH